MRFDLDNPHLTIEPVYDDVLITFKDSRIADEDHKAFDIATRGKKQKVKKAPRRDHTDDQKMALAALMEQVTPAIPEPAPEPTPDE